jgi:hypothetical protein
MEERTNAKMDSYQKKADGDRDELKAIMNAFEEKMDSNQAKAAKQEQMLAEMNAKMDANMTNMAAIRSELEETMEPGRRAPPEAEERDRRILRITEKSDGSRQKDVPPCNSGMAENSSGKKNGIRSRHVKEPPHLRTWRKTASMSGGRNRGEQSRLEGHNTLSKDLSKLLDLNCHF